jgi:hypothetical protein
MTGTLIPFAGDDLRPRRKVAPTRRKVAPTADSLFRLGRDTIEIAAILGCDEPEALKRLSVERSARLGLDRPYEPDTKRPGRPKRVAHD